MGTVIEFFVEVFKENNTLRICSPEVSTSHGFTLGGYLSKANKVCETRVLSLSFQHLKKIYYPWNEKTEFSVEIAGLQNDS